jgi:uncharacterized protein
VRDDPGTVHVGVARLELHLPGVASLKGKRALLNRAKAALRSDLDVSVTEVGWQDSWQRSALGVGVVASTPDGVDRVLDRMVAVVERDPRVEVLRAVVQVDVLDLDEGEEIR